MSDNIIKPNYNRSVLSVSSSILNYYGVSSNYKSLKEIDDILKKGYRNVIFLVLDGLGMNILEKNLLKKSFLKKNLLTNVTTVFPPTTAAATIAIHSGVSPFENGWVGWMPYFKEYDRMIELFSGNDFYTREKIIEKPEIDFMKYETIYEKICKKNSDVNYHKIFPNFDGNGSDTFEELCDNIRNVCKKDGRNLISAYWIEPDHTIHYSGIESDQVKDILEEIDLNLKKISKQLKDTIIIITADHGAVMVDEVYLNEIKEIDECLVRPPSIESRFVSFFIKKGMKAKFKKLIKDYFPGKFILYTKSEFLNENLLGYGEKHSRIDDYLGDFILISKEDISIRYSTSGTRDKIHVADHGGITPDEMLVPVIVIDCK